jgi:hypothetical protein
LVGFLWVGMPTMPLPFTFLAAMLLPVLCTYPTVSLYAHISTFYLQTLPLGVSVHHYCLPLSSSPWVPCLLLHMAFCSMPVEGPFTFTPFSLCMSVLILFLVCAARLHSEL